MAGKTLMLVGVLALACLASASVDSLQAQGAELQHEGVLLPPALEHCLKVRHASSIGQPSQC